jgi:hypothetical protein
VKSGPASALTAFTVSSPSMAAAVGSAIIWLIFRKQSSGRPRPTAFIGTPCTWRSPH